MKLLSTQTHTIIGLIVGVALIMAPWLFGFANLEANAWVPHVIVGILVVGYAVITRAAEEKPSITT